MDLRENQKARTHEAPNGGMSRPNSVISRTAASNAMAAKPPRPASAAFLHGRSLSQAHANWLETTICFGPICYWFVSGCKTAKRGVVTTLCDAPLDHFLNFAASSDPPVALPAL